MPPGTAFELLSFCAAERSVAHVVGTFAPAFLSMSVFTNMASGPQSFGKPYVSPLYLKPFKSRGKKGLVLKWNFLAYGVRVPARPAAPRPGTHGR